MEQKYHGSPLSRICYQDSTYMLETLLPFVPPNMKLPLALMIKWSEFQRILKVFQNTKLLHEYGLFESEFSMEKYANQLADCPNKKLADSISQMGRMMQMMQMMQVMNAMNEAADFGSLFGAFGEAPDTESSVTAPDMPDQEEINDIVKNLFPDGDAQKDTENMLPDIVQETDEAQESAENEALQTDDTFDIEEFVKEVFS